MLLSLLFACATGPTAQPVLADADRPPDVYLIMVDTLRADHLGVYGYPHPTSPILDAWAKDAVVFEQAQTVAPWTLPTIASVMTGHHPYSVGIRDEQTSVDESVTTLGELYNQAGYNTVGVVSHIYLLPKYQLMQGFRKLDSREVTNNHADITSEEVTTRAIGYLFEHQATQPDTPLFMVAHYFDPHYDFHHHKELFDSFPEYGGAMDKVSSVRRQRAIINAADGQDLEDARRQLANAYDSEIRLTDWHLNRLFDAIERSGRGNNALVVVIGDHGEELATRDTRWVGHTKVVSQDVLHVPLIMKLPGGKQPRARITEPVSLVDLMPTIAAQSGLQLPDDLKVYGNALDLSSSADYRKTVHSETGRWAQLQVSREGNWKLIADRAVDPPGYTLYDLSADPGELTDVAEAHPDVVARLAADLDAWNVAIEADRKVMMPSATQPELSEEEIEALRAMGYME